MMKRPDYAELLRLFEECLSVTYRRVENDASFAVKRVNDGVTIFFEPSNGSLDWKNNFRFATRPYRRMEEVWYCHRGFLSVFRAALPYLEDLIADTSVKSFTVVGYSHGAALALLCHEYIAFHRPDVKESLLGVGFGCPRVISGKLPPTVAARFAGFYPVKNIDDLVTHLPPRLFGYRHVKPPLLIGWRGKYNMIDAHRPEAYKRELLFAAERRKRKDELYDQRGDHDLADTT